MSDELKILVARRVRDFRMERKLNQERLGELAGLSPSVISRLEREPQNLGLETIAKIATALGVQPYELLVDPAVGITEVGRDRLRQALRLISSVVDEEL